MKGSLYLGKIAGIRLQMHWTFVLIILWAIYIGWRQGGNIQSISWTIAFVLAIFACVILHELGHSLTARRYGIETRKITLLPIGGVASLDRMPEDPKQELMVAIMGPMVNVVIAVLLFLFIYPQLSVFQHADETQQFLQTINAQNFVLYLFTSNIILVLFNVIPAFPMDGGRVLRALLSMRMDRVRATQIASNLGQLIAIFFFFIGMFYNLFLIFIGLFVYFGASGEYMMIRQMAILKGHKVREAMMTKFTVIRPDDDLQRISQVLLSGSERHFPVVREGFGVVGLLYNQKIVEAYSNGKIHSLVEKLMETKFKSLEPGEDLSQVYREAQSQGQKFFPIVEKGELLGTIDMDNINEFIMIQASLDY